MFVDFPLNPGFIGGSRGGVRDARPPPGRPNSFDFMQFSGKFGVFTPPLEGSRPPSGKSWIRHWDYLLICLHTYLGQFYNQHWVRDIKWWITRSWYCVLMFIAKHFLRLCQVKGIAWFLRSLITVQFRDWIIMKFFQWKVQFHPLNFLMLMKVYAHSCLLPQSLRVGDKEVSDIR